MGPLNETKKEAGLESLKTPTVEQTPWGSARLIEDIQNSWRNGNFSGAALMATVGSIPLAGSFIGHSFASVGEGLMPSMGNADVPLGATDAMHPASYRTTEDLAGNLVALAAVNATHLAVVGGIGAIGCALYVPGKTVELTSEVAAEAVRLIIGKS